MSRPDARGILFLCVSTLISLCWGIALERSSPFGMLDFKGVYYGAQCLLNQCDPYDVPSLQNFYLQHGGQPPSSAVNARKLMVVSLYINSPFTFLFIAPLALLRWSLAQTVWMILIAVGLIASSVLMWVEGRVHSQNAALLFACAALLNCELLIAGGNTAGFVVSACVLSAWCILRDSNVAFGVLALAVAMLIKPHVAGPIWCCFFFSGSRFRKRALQTLAIAAVFALPTMLWVSHVSPHWRSEMQTNLTSISSNSGINSPEPFSVGMSNPDCIVDLQTVLSIFVPQPFLYNALTYLVCGALFLIWVRNAIQANASTDDLWLSLAFVVPLTLLFTYHRIHDCKVMLLTIPACTRLWARRGVIGWLALLINGLAIFATSEIPSTFLVGATNRLQFAQASIAQKIALLPLARSAPLLLLAMAIFYLVIYLSESKSQTSYERSTRDIDRVSLGRPHHSAIKATGNLAKHASA